jgi:predicted MPP superfamily phosphohydrolase
MIDDDTQSPTYITRGLGTSNLEFELRLFATPEIVVINP